VLDSTSAHLVSDDGDPDDETAGPSPRLITGEGNDIDLSRTKLMPRRWKARLE
jgi:hypothetical protein